MAEAKMPSITVQEIEPVAFRAMLRFMYTDSFHDRYALDRLKLICSLKLIENVSAGTVGSILVCGETYNCSELKAKCLGFFAVEKNFKEAVFTDGFAILLQRFPSLAAELKKRVVM
ncbi:hypothetical protein U9M48_038184 [Paspalum notatum var. saurae]|uniref:BPM/SPOP BACK domain-containing protein n=1 Tax=Paspalum notatum var. saurae TaxID=547442 RepID=A0AAQ3UMS7_PASNO